MENLPGVPTISTAADPRRTWGQQTDRLTTIGTALASIVDRRWGKGRGRRPGGVSGPTGPAFEPSPECPNRAGQRFSNRAGFLQTAPATGNPARCEHSSCHCSQQRPQWQLREIKQRRYADPGGGKSCHPQNPYLTPPESGQPEKRCQTVTTGFPQILWL